MGKPGIWVPAHYQFLPCIFKRGSPTLTSVSSNKVVGLDDLPTLGWLCSILPVLTRSSTQGSERWKILPLCSRSSPFNWGHMIDTHGKKASALPISQPHLCSSLPCYRQLPLPLCLCLWCWFLCHGGGLPSGCGEDPVYELTPRPVPQPPGLYAEDVGPGGSLSLL